MTTQEVKAWLIGVKNSQIEFKFARDKYNELYKQLQCSKPIQYGNNGSSHESKRNSVESAYILLDQYEREYHYKMQAAFDARTTAEKYINQLPFPDRAVIYRRYICGQTWECIADSLMYSRQHVTRIHGRAMQKMCLYVTL